jgi:ABC-type microcin C transport system duplicated ATPase subunit YejF
MIELTSVSKAFVSQGRRVVNAVQDVSLTVQPHETVALIGESGSGKSTVGRLALGLLAPSAGVVRFAGRDLAGRSAVDMADFRRRVSVVFQEPYQSLNPRMRVEDIVGEPLVIHRMASRDERRKRVAEALEEVNLAPDMARRFPGELSGGQQQRVGIARALITQPEFIVLDEPTSSLDLSIQAGILLLLSDLQRRHGIAYLYISHDIGTVGYFSQRVAVMRQGRIVEEGLTATVLESPREEYTKELMAATLSIEPADMP